MADTATAHPLAVPTSPTLSIPSAYLSTSPTLRGSHVSLFSGTTASTSTPITHAATPLQTYVRRVSFDAMTHIDLPSYSFTLQAKSQGFKRSKRSRCFLVATDLNTYSDYALEWTIERLLDDGDEVVVLRVVTVDMSASKSNIANTLSEQEQQAREDAQKVMEAIMMKNEDKQISIVVEFVVGKVQATIQHMIAMYQPSMLVVGTRGRSPVKGFLLGSVSRYCLQHSPVPVTVVRPENRGQKYKDKRRRLSKLIKIRVGSMRGSKVDVASVPPLPEDSREREGSRSSSGSISEMLSTPGIKEIERRSVESNGSMLDLRWD